MKLVAAPNALKGSLSACAAAAAIARGARRAQPNIEVLELGIADGGDGTAEVICRARGGSFRAVTAADPLGRPRSARYAWLEDGTAVIDVATASGLSLLQKDEQRALTATSYGTGELMRAALDAGCERIVLGVGGSATVDCGSGILQALGARLLDADERELPPGGAALARLSRIDLSQLHPRLAHASLEIACDVDSTLLGEHGAARAFGPQKGATPAQVELLERSLSQFALVAGAAFGRALEEVPGGGAAGGIAAGLFGVLGAKLSPGIDLVLETVRFDSALAGATLCITAEGLLDRQSLRNKGPLGVARWAAARRVPVVALCGGIADDVADGDLPGLTGAFSICRRPMSLEHAMHAAAELMERAAEQTVRLFSCAK
jgi:glycerate kinase